MEVKMDINELRALENQISKLTAEKEDLISKQKQVVIYHKYFNGKLKVVPGQKADYSVNIYGVRENRMMGRWDTMPSSRYSDFCMDIDIAEAIKKGWVEIDLSENSSKHTKDYVNMSEVIEDIHKEEFAKVREDLAIAQQRATEAEHLSVTVADKYEKEILKIREAHQDFNSQVSKEHEERILRLNKKYEDFEKQSKEEFDKLSQEFADFKEDKKRVSLEQQLAEALETIKKLEEENAKPWYRKIF